MIQMSQFSVVWYRDIFRIHLCLVTSKTYQISLPNIIGECSSKSLHPKFALFKTLSGFLLVTFRFCGHETLYFLNVLDPGVPGKRITALLVQYLLGQNNNVILKMQLFDDRWINNEKALLFKIHWLVTHCKQSRDDLTAPTMWLLV